MTEAGRMDWRNRVGVQRRNIGVNRRYVGVGRRYVGVGRRCDRANRRYVGVGRRDIGAKRRCVGASRRCVGVGMDVTHFTDITPPMANSDTLVSRQNLQSWSGYCNTGAQVKAAFKALNAVHSFSPKWNTTSLHVKSVIGLAMIAYSLTNHL